MIIGNIDIMNKTFLFAVLLVFLSQTMFAQEIAQWRGPNRNGIYPEKGLLKEWAENGPELIWKYESLGQGYTSVAVTKDIVFTTGTNDSVSYIFAFNHKGKLLWKKKYGKEWTTNFPGVRSTPLIYDGKGYLVSGLGVLHCFKAKNGKKLWSKDLFKDFDGENIKFGFTENLLIDGDKLFCTPGGKEANVVALNRNTGKVIWKSKGNGEKSAYCSPIMINVKGKKLFVTNTAKCIIALDSENGKLIWASDMKFKHGIHGNTPTYHDNYLFAMNGWGAGSVMFKLSENGAKIEEAWRSKLFDLEHGDVVKLNENIYGADYTTKHFSCVDWKTGNVKKSIKECSPSTVLAADGMIYCFTYKGEMVLMKPSKDGFEIISKFKPGSPKKDYIAHPVIKDGKLYLRYSNNLWVYNIKK